MRLNISVPDALAAQVRERGMPVSAVCQAALRDELNRLDDTSQKECCGLPMSTLDIFGVRLYRCVHRGHHPLVFRNLNTGEELTESYDDGADGGLEWTSHYGECPS